ncbi:copper chaperone PCu(A)C [Streptomyces marincola]|uniref:copper chaperone PCu(A)C n=1 Tax=Streptomyces marincola TaxID=2878388 RepID=UPI001CF0F8C1|nr:copper chaperone PCu(A)C [Streptomyces marincola]UCM89826.1 copper chaperone PCu(A)C [Streptomyces marincola]
MSARPRREALLAALVPLAAGAAALLGLTAWTLSGAAGRPATMAVTAPEVFLTYAERPVTSAYFTLRNTGGSDDRLIAVTSDEAEDVMLSAHHHAASGSGGMRMTDALAVPAGATVRMSPFTVSVMLTPERRLAEGDTVPFVLRFAHAAPVRVTATVVRPGT